MLLCESGMYDGDYEFNSEGPLQYSYTGYSHR